MAPLNQFFRAAGTLLVVSRGRDAMDPPGDMPWALTRAELDAREIGLPLVSFEDYYDAGTPPVRRFRAVYRACDVCATGGGRQRCSCCDTW